MITKSGSELFAHTTNQDSLKKMLESGQIKSLARIARDTPDAEISVEPLPLPLRMKMRAQDALERMKGIKETSRIFLTKGGYLPNYGDCIIYKRLGNSVKRSEALNSVPEEFHTGRTLSLRRNADIYLPDEKLDEFREAWSGYKFLPKSQFPARAYGLWDRACALAAKIKNRLVKEGGERVSPRDFGRNAILCGSHALGINLENASDVDIFVPYKRRRWFEDA